MDDGPRDREYRYSVKNIRLESGERFARQYDIRLGLPLEETTRYSVAFRRGECSSVSMRDLAEEGGVSFATP